MKIATWNVERLTTNSKRVPLITECLQKIDADILILTETNEAIYLGEAYKYFHTDVLLGSYYKTGERRTSIYSKYPLIEKVVTFRADTSLSIKLNTPFGDLAVYGTVVGIHGNRRESFEQDLAKQITDFEQIATTGNFCIAGDLNISFSDNYYHTVKGREKLNAAFQKLQLKNLTESIPENIDHIVVSDEFITARSIKLSTWNVTKELSDHIGVCVTIG